MRITMILLACTIVVLASCNSSDPTSTQGSADFPRNTEWVGVMDGIGSQYPPPANLQFRDNNEIVVYGRHIITVDGGWALQDSVKGTITSVTEVDNTTTEVKANIYNYGDLTLTIKDRKTLTSLSADGSKVLFTLDYYEATERFGATYSGPIMTGSGPTVGMLSYPDLSSITFNYNGTTTYKRNGEDVKVGVAAPSPDMRILVLPYRKVGATVFMYGWNESLLQPEAYMYMGVLMPGDKKMLVSSNVMGTRLPYHAQTIPWYGTIGQTPFIERE